MNKDSEGTEGIKCNQWLRILMFVSRGYYRSHVFADPQQQLVCGIHMHDLVGRLPFPCSKKSISFNQQEYM